mmetsp:Transcript_30624/g.84451  ORF Transcript_30624/g.84451 Transcript_30624/m.84451 type:complete len:408 (-) Transcript_30624:540-1763(-)
MPPGAADGAQHSPHGLRIFLLHRLENTRLWATALAPCCSVPGHLQEVAHGGRADPACRVRGPKDLAALGDRVVGVLAATKGHAARVAALAAPAADLACVRVVAALTNGVDEQRLHLQCEVEEIPAGLVEGALVAAPLAPKGAERPGGAGQRPMPGPRLLGSHDGVHEARLSHECKAPPGLAEQLERVRHVAVAGGLSPECIALVLGKVPRVCGQHPRQELAVQVCGLLALLGGAEQLIQRPPLRAIWPVTWFRRLRRRCGLGRFLRPLRGLDAFQADHKVFLVVVEAPARATTTQDAPGALPSVHAPPLGKVFCAASLCRGVPISSHPDSWPALLKLLVVLDTALVHIVGTYERPGAPLFPEESIVLEARTMLIRGHRLLDGVLRCLTVCCGCHLLRCLLVEAEEFD